jgi:hypothetical protein
MRYGFRIVAALCLVALLVPVAAVAKDARVQGPSILKGAGFYGGELQLAMEDGQRPVKIVGGAGHIGVLDVGGDLKIRCTGKGRVQSKQTDNGTVYTCAGRRGGEIVLLGSHFKFRGFAKRYLVKLPAGASGSFHGRFVVGGEGGEDEGEGERPARERKRPEPTRPEPKREPIPAPAAPIGRDG